MSSVSDTIESGHRYSRSHGKGCCSKGNWSGINIAAMVIGFVLFWPLGLAILYWNITGRDLKDLPSAAQKKWSAMFNGASNQKESYGENSIFDEYQQTQYDRISELKEEIKNRARNFRVFRSDAKRRADEVEFNDFMSSDRSSQDD